VKTKVALFRKWNKRKQISILFKLKLRKKNFHNII